MKRFAITSFLGAALCCSLVAGCGGGDEESAATADPIANALGKSGNTTGEKSSDPIANALGK